MLRTTLPAVLRDKTGATAIEYALLAALISVAFIIALISTGSSIDDMLTHVATVLRDAAEEAAGS
jgi:Flp pilus assembly pilin Flp